jgi:hypothetical protein
MNKDEIAETHNKAKCHNFVNTVFIKLMDWINMSYSRIILYSRVSYLVKKEDCLQFLYDI